MTALPNHILDKMSPEDRKAFGQMTAQEANEAYIAKSEREEQRTFYSWLLLHEGAGKLTFYTTRTDRKTTGRPGWPDFQVLYCGGSLFFEFKVKGGRFSQDQVEMIDRLTAVGHLVVIPETAHQAIEICCAWMSKAFNGGKNGSEK